MLPGIKEWLSASWADYRRRWGSVMAVIAAGGLATAAAVFLPLAAAGLVSLAVPGAAWAVWGAASAAALLAALWLSAWGQAAAVLAAGGEAAPSESLAEGWRRTGQFAWVVTLVMLAAGGGFVLLLVPGLILGVLLFFAPFYQLAGEAEGMAAVELSFARVRPVLWDVSARLSLLALIAGAPAWIPWIGWLVGPLWAPFGLTAGARLAADLKALSPEPARPRLGSAVAALGALLLAASVAASWSAARLASSLYAAVSSGALELKAPDAETARSLTAVLEGTATDDDRGRAMSFALALSSAALAAP